jgi:hypothetical protein
LRLATTLRYLYLSYLSKPAADRRLYRIVRDLRPHRMLEIGIGSMDRTLRLLDFAQRVNGGEAVRYAAIDLFEARSASQSKLSLKEAHRVLKGATSQAQLIPGDPSGALARVANSLPNLDLVMISGDSDDASLEGAWFFLPRMLHDHSVVLRQRPGADGVFEPIPLQTIRERATTRRRAA